MSIEKAKKLAKHFYKYKKLTTPVDIRSVISKYAFVEELQIPIENVDGICIMKHGSPYVIVQKNSSENRKRFTLAHELGHIVIPEHYGLISCNTELNATKEDSSDYYEKEQEANAFAAELLIPENIVISELKSWNNQFATAVNQVATKSSVSALSAFYRVLDILPGCKHVYFDDHINQYRHNFPVKSEVWPLFLRNEEQEIDIEWLKTVCIGKETITDDTFDAEVLFFPECPREEAFIKVKQLFTDEKGVETALNYIIRSRLSLPHWFGGIRNYLPRGFFVKIEYNKTRNWAVIKSKETDINLRRSIDFDMWMENNSDFSVQKWHNGTEITVWYIAPVEKVFDSGDSRCSKDILREIINNASADPIERRTLFGKINGVVGALNSQFRDLDPKEFYRKLYEKFVGRDELWLITQDLEFHQFLVNKTKELYGITKIE